MASKVSQHILYKVLSGALLIFSVSTVFNNLYAHGLGGSGMSYNFDENDNAVDLEMKRKAAEEQEARDDWDNFMKAVKEQEAKNNNDDESREARHQSGDHSHGY